MALIINLFLSFSLLYLVLFVFLFLTKKINRKAFEEMMGLADNTREDIINCKWKNKK